MIVFGVSSGRGNGMPVVVAGVRRGGVDVSAGLHRRSPRGRPDEPDRHGLRARWPAVRVRAGRPAACDQRRTAAAGAVRHADGERGRRAGPARRGVRSRVRHQPLGLRLLHRHDAGHPQPRQPFHRRRRRRARGERARPPRSQRRAGDQQREPQRRRAPVRPRREALHLGRRQRRRQQLAEPPDPFRQDPAGQRRRQHPARQPVLRHGGGRAPRHLGARAAQSVHDRGPAGDRPPVRQRRGPERLGRDQRRDGRGQLRLADV